jgi:excisionase family DNA binding protein
MVSEELKTRVNALPTILSIREAADFFSVRYLTVWRLIRRGRLPAYKDGEGNWCVLKSDIKTFCSRNSNL